MKRLALLALLLTACGVHPAPSTAYLAPASSADVARTEAVVALFEAAQPEPDATPEPAAKRCIVVVKTTPTQQIATVGGKDCKPSDFI
ncbi:hypothetical protein [Deinococcus irradiatisoli]|uniref:hypothetical protein n=1 Tax=Deinococcus irradiatisoli TaxID=2202254 RepID=UPI0011B2325B|nr:hypothetical protein [Deinococcus irradiatisoli]